MSDQTLITPISSKTTDAQKGKRTFRREMVFVGIFLLFAIVLRLYVLGDNLLVSDDSRNFGPIRPSQVLGKVIP